MYQVLQIRLYVIFRSLSLSLPPPPPPLHLSLCFCTSICTTEFVIEPPVGPDMPLIMPEGGSRTLTCRHVSPIRRPAFTLNWFRDATVIRPSDEADTRGDCSCDVEPIDPTDTTITERVLNFIDFAGTSAGEYSCRGPDNDTFTDEASCRFQVLLAGELLVQWLCTCMCVCVCACTCVHVCVPVCMHVILSARALLVCVSFVAILME